MPVSSVTRLRRPLPREAVDGLQSHLARQKPSQKVRSGIHEGMKAGKNQEGGRKGHSSPGPRGDVFWPPANLPSREDFGCVFTEQAHITDQVAVAAGRSLIRPAGMLTESAGSRARLGAPLGARGAIFQRVGKTDRRAERPQATKTRGRPERRAQPSPAPAVPRGTAATPSHRRRLDRHPFHAQQRNATMKITSQTDGCSTWNRRLAVKLGLVGRATDRYTGRASSAQ